MKPERPTPVLVMAILNFVFGGLSVVGMICDELAMLGMGALAKSASPGPKGTPNPLAEVMTLYDRIPGFYAYTVISGVLGLIAAIILIIAGVGLLKMRPWARWTCIGYGIYTILATFGSLLYTLTVVNPAVQKWQVEFAQRMGSPVAAGGNPMANNILSIFGSICGVTYAVALLIVMFLPSVAAAFAGQIGPADAPD